MCASAFDPQRDPRSICTLLTWRGLGADAKSCQCKKILTTNSGEELRAAVPLQSIRLVRQSDKTIANQLNMNHFSKDELRRIGFHIQFHRSGALFARCWYVD
ncbi:YjbD family protein [Vibrio chagasii]|nr:YjbD family protein [Vibrio chagasii]